MEETTFAEVLARAPEDIALDEVALLISQRLQPGLDVIEWMAALDELAADCPTPTAEGVARHLFGTERFTGNDRDYYDWRNSCLDRVIATRRGIPITLSIVMIEVARRVGVPLVGVSVPTHFIVRDRDDTDVFFDPFDAGRRLDRNEAMSRFAMVAHGRVQWNGHLLDPTPKRDIVVRMLNNLKGLFARGSDPVRLGVVMGLRAEVDELARAESAEILNATAVFN